MELAVSLAFFFKYTHGHLLCFRHWGRDQREMKEAVVIITELALGRGWGGEGQVASDITESLEFGVLTFYEFLFLGVGGTL